MNLKISLLQILPTATVAGNLSKGVHFCRMAKALGADVALFPEMWSIGYRIYDRPPEVWIREAIPENDRFITTFGELAGELEMAIGITFLEAASAGPRNTLLLFDRHGGKALSYSKVHTCDFDVERHLVPGSDFPVAELDTAAGKVKTGAMICYDREFPESARILMLTVLKNSVPVAVAAASLDERALSESRRILLFALTDARSSNMKFLDREETRIKYAAKGSLPVLIKTGVFKIALERSGGKMKCYALDLSGKRVGEIPVKQESGRLVLEFDTAKTPIPATSYELVAAD